MSVSTLEPVPRLALVPPVAQARALIQHMDARTLEDQRTIACIAAPPFGESARAAWMRGALQDAGASAIEEDREGNVTARLEGSDDDAAPVIIAAHLDSVFPDGTALHLREEGRRLLLPGIADNARGLAAMLALVRAMRQAGLQPRRTLVFAATVGEEGVGDLRGVKYLLCDGSPLRDAAAFIALDGTEVRRIVTRSVGSRRYRVVLRGPGGHSWADRGTVNPAHAVGAVIVELGRVRLAPAPAWSLNIGRIGGGTSVNAIPEEAWLELDLRSDDAASLATLELRAMQAIDKAVALVNADRRRTGAAIRAETLAIGVRPAGATPADAPLVQAARAATRYIGRRPELVASSTDANVPMALGIPAIAIGAGGESGGMHTLHEWYENERGSEGIVRALLTLLAVAGVSR